MKFLTLILILLPLITLVQCIKQSCPQQDFLQEIEDLHNREKRSVISANIQKTIDLYLTPEAGGVALIISTSIMIFQTVGYILFGKICCRFLFHGKMPLSKCFPTLSEKFLIVNVHVTLN